MFIARAVTIAPWVADFVKEEGAVVAEKTDAQEVLMHQPDEVNAGRCRALMWNGGRGKLQCSRKPLRGRNSVAAAKQKARRMGRCVERFPPGS